MKYYLYCIRDKYTGYLAPTPHLNDDAAKRDFAFSINNNPGIMNFAPADYDLFRVGEFDTKSGSVENGIQVFIANGMEVFVDAKPES